MKKKRCERCGHVHRRNEKKKDWEACKVCGCAVLVVGNKEVG